MKSRHSKEIKEEKMSSSSTYSSFLSFKYNSIGLWNDFERDNLKEEIDHLKLFSHD
jgi:hypothetical protein